MPTVSKTLVKSLIADSLDDAITAKENDIAKAQTKLHVMQELKRLVETDSPLVGTTFLFSIPGDGNFYNTSFDVVVGESQAGFFEAMHAAVTNWHKKYGGLRNYVDQGHMPSAQININNLHIVRVPVEIWQKKFDQLVPK